MAVSTSSSSGLKKFAVELITLGLCTKYEPRQIASRLSAAHASLVQAVEELRDFSEMLSDEEFTQHLIKCSGLVQLVVEQMGKQAAKKASVVGMKKFSTMVEMAREYELECLKAANEVTQSSSRAQGRALGEERFTGSRTLTTPDDLERRLRRLTELAADLGIDLALFSQPLPQRGSSPYDLASGFDDMDLKDTEENPLVYGTVEVDFEHVDSKIKPLVEKLQGLFRNMEEYKRLTACRSSNAQKLLDIFQRLLDSLDAPPPSFHRNLVTATQRLSWKSGLYPMCYELTEVTMDLGKRVASGGFADIHRGTFQGRHVCLKVIRSDLDPETQAERWLKAFSRECILWGQLSHPNLLPFYGIFRIGNHIAFVAPWMDHGHVIQYLKQHPTANRVLLLLDIAKGLQFLHRQEIIHGDLKGRNILVNDSGRACLADFGISSISDENILKWASQSSVASRGGSLRWQSPELLDPKSIKDTRNTKASDIYAWSCVAYEIFTGDLPFNHIEHNSLVRREIITGGRPRRPPVFSPSWNKWGLTENMWILMQECWVPDRMKRPAVGEVIRRLTAMVPPEDSPAAEQNSAFSAAKFRVSMHAGLSYDELTLDIFESLVESSMASDDAGA